METNLFSVIVPVYKVEPYLRRCVDSILRQTISDFELLLIDDGSPDKSGEICDEYAKTDSRVKVIHKLNGGLSSARNAGLDIATGKYICFIDSDDYVDENYLEVLYPKNDEDLVCCSLQSDAAQICLTECCMDTKAFLKDNTQRYAFAVAWCKSFKHSLIKQYNLRFREDIKIGEDIIWMLGFMSSHEELVVTSKSDITYHYELGNPNSLTKKIVPLEASLKSIEYITQQFKILSDMYDWDNNFELKEYQCSQFYNMLGTIRNSKQCKKMKTLYSILKLYPVYDLLTDKSFWLTRYKGSKIKCIMTSCVVPLISLFYMIIGKPKTL